MEWETWWSYRKKHAANNFTRQLRLDGIWMFTLTNQDFRQVYLISLIVPLVIKLGT